MAKNKGIMGIPGFKSQKEITKTFQGALIESLAGVGAGIAASFLMIPVQKKLPEVARRFTGMGIAGIGLGISVIGKHEAVKSAGTGVATVGAIQAFMDLAPKDLVGQMSFGLNGVESNSNSNTGIIDQATLNRLAAEVEAEIELEIEAEIVAEIEANYVYDEDVSESYDDDIIRGDS